MSNSRHPFTCYFCNEFIENETEIGHSTLCSKVLVPCPFKCGSYVQRANILKHKTECNNNIRKSLSLDENTLNNPVKNTNSLDRNGHSNKSKVQGEAASLNRRLAELELKMASASNSRHFNASSSFPIASFEEIKNSLKQQTLSIQKINYFNGFISEWKKNIDTQLTGLKSSLTSIENIKDFTNRLSYIQEKLLYLQNMQMDLNLLKESVFKENTNFKKNDMDLAMNLEQIRSTFNKQNMSFEQMWSQQTDVIQNIMKDVEDIKNAFDEQKAKHAGLVFDLRSVMQISSEAAEKIEILERDFNIMRQEVSQMKVNLEILEDLGCRDGAAHKRLIWRITEVECKLKRAKENEIVLKSPIFYTHQYGYKIRVLLYINGLKKWRDRYALVCIHVLKGEYDPLLTWPCIIEGTITLRNVADKSQTKNVSKYIKIKRDSGDEDEDEPQESSSTYIFIPHSVLFKECYTKDDTFFLDISINDTKKCETSL